MPNPRSICSVSKSRLFTVLVVCLLVCPSVFAGKLRDFEKDATENKEKSADKNCATVSYRGDEDDSDSDHDPFGFFLVGAVIVEGGVNSWNRVAPEERKTTRICNEFLSPSDRRRLGEALVPFARLDAAYQNVESDVHALDTRLELGYGPFAVQARRTHYEEGDPNDTLDISLLHFVYRMSFRNSLEVDFAFGQLTIDGLNENSDFSVSLPILFHPKEWLGIEFRPAWASINENVIQDYDLSLLCGWRHVSFRVGYRWFESENESLNGPHFGLSLRL